MKSRRPTQPKNTRKVTDAIIAKRYLDLQRLRDEIRRMEISRGTPSLDSESLRVEDMQQ